MSAKEPFRWWKRDEEQHVQGAEVESCYNNLFVHE